MAKKKTAEAEGKPAESSSDDGKPAVALQEPNLPGMKPERIEAVEATMERWIKKNAEAELLLADLEIIEGELEQTMRASDVLIYKLRSFTAKLAIEEKFKVKVEKQDALHDGVALKRPSLSVART